MFPMLKPLEAKLAEVFKDGPHLPENARKSLATKWYPWIAIIFGVLQVLAVLALWRAGHTVDDFVDYANRISRAYGGKEVSSSLGLTYWLSLIVLAADAVILLMAYPGLKAKKKVGWDWLFLGALVNLAYGVLSIFVNGNYGGGFGNFVSSAIGSLIAFWLLFEARNYYTGSATKASEKPAEKK